MAGSINKVTLIGNLGKDPEVRHTQDGAPIVTLAIATSDSWKDKATGEKREKTEWHRVVMFGKLAEIAGEYLKKGSKVYIEGELRTRDWEKDGQKHYTTEVVASEMQMLDSRGEMGGGGSSFGGSGGGQGGGSSSGGSGGSQGGGGSSPAGDDFGPPPSDDFDDDIPF